MYRIIYLVPCAQILITIIGLDNNNILDRLRPTYNARLLKIVKRSDQ